MANAKDTASTRAIPSAGPDFEHLLAQEVVIEAGEGTTRTGAQAIAPDHSPRPPELASRADALPQAGLLAAGAAADVQREVEQFLYRQAELLDGKHWQAFIDLFADDGVYWMPVTREQTEWEGSPSIFAEDKLMMEIRKGRVSHPNAWSQAPMWETNHLVSHVAIESVTPTAVEVRSRFHMMELRRDALRHFGGSYRHSLVRDGDGGLRIKLQRVDLFNGQAPFDYVLQVWV
jgi:3-phenylpropionate/cinnamic acid dioxygenase small subunit